MATFKGETHDAESGESFVVPVRQDGIVEDGLDGVVGVLCCVHAPMVVSTTASAHGAIASNMSGQATGCCLRTAVLMG